MKKIKLVVGVLGFMFAFVACEKKPAENMGTAGTEPAAVVESHEAAAPEAAPSSEPADEGHPEDSAM